MGLSGPNTGTRKKGSKKMIDKKANLALDLIQVIVDYTEDVYIQEQLTIIWDLINSDLKYTKERDKWHIEKQ